MSASIDQRLISDVTAIILRHAAPARIWLFGSRAIGEAHAGSDYDFAFDDAALEADALERIRHDIDTLPTLHKIDVSNIAHAEARFANRVRDTGRVLYSASKALRAEDGLLYLQRALARLQQAVISADAMREQGFGDAVLDLTVQRFEFTYEMAWKALKRYLDFCGLEAKSPRAVFREAYAQGLLGDEAVWLDMIEMRNLASHVYDEAEISRLLDKIGAYLAAFTALATSLQTELAKEAGTVPFRPAGGLGDAVGVTHQRVNE